VARAVEGWLRAHADERANVAEQLRGADVVINAAGRAQPASGDLGDLFDANAVLPGVLATITADAGVRRLVHVSTAAVQGRRDPLDETAAVAPFSPYSRSKVAGEDILARLTRRPPEVTLYRPTSVQGMGRPMTRRVLEVVRRGRFVVPGNGDVPIPLCLIENVAAGILHAAAMKDSFAVVLQPWEGVTPRLLLESIGLHPRFVPVPKKAVNAAVGAALRSNAPRLMAPARRAEMLLLGQRQVTSALEAAGFQPPVGLEGYRRLATLGETTV
jgi:nucleoside-diphosphate-sugar epimerase